MGKSILIIEDNVETAKNIRLFLEHNNLDCQIANTGNQGITFFFKEHYDLIVLDVMLPDGDGFHVCKTIRESSDVPIVMLTAKVSETDLIRGLNCGANDYVKKPYSNKELVARINAHLRSRHNNVDIIKIGPYNQNLTNRVLLVNKVALTLTRTEFDIMNMFLKYPGRVFSREQLFLAVYEETSESFDRTVDVHVHNLRKKIIAKGLKEHFIKSVYGIGYKLDL